MSSTADVLDHHLDAFGNTDLEETLADYGDDSVVVTQDRVYRGLDEISTLFEGFFAEFESPETTFTLDQQVVEGEYAYIVWHADTPENEYEFATDTFHVVDGTIVAQTVAVVVTPKA